MQDIQKHSGEHIQKLEYQIMVLHQKVEHLEQQLAIVQEMGRRYPAVVFSNEPLTKAELARGLEIAAEINRGK